MKTQNRIYRSHWSNYGPKFGLLEESEIENSDWEHVLSPYDLDFTEVEEDDDFTSINEK
ncbi:hypothetical protein GVN16_04025 [Emticicia sp. CRIBPO]|uniref:hypothetical protein n=1 Tax=Emticicia sp. CRIBPO TaxID=2683258 RepID=UPI00141372DF|nr:hypothetical protein [Emticicia sp. CRIBPO]NBA84910.1 hypothetical protein [Emticicia sp. CRIBPO]